MAQGGFPGRVRAMVRSGGGRSSPSGQGRCVVARKGPTGPGPSFFGTWVVSRPRRRSHHGDPVSGGNPGRRLKQEVRRGRRDRVEPPAGPAATFPCNHLVGRPPNG